MAATPTVAILAGGLATRLRPITEKIPKALVPVAGRPFLAHQLELLTRQGFEHAVLCVGHLGEQIEAAFGDGRDHGLRLDYSYDGEQLVGTAGALRRALPKLGDAFLTLYGDSYLEIDYLAVWRAFQESGLPALMTVMENSRGTEPSNVVFAAGKVRLYDKKNPTPLMHHIDYGLGAYRASVFRDLPEGPADLSALQSSLARQWLMAGCEVDRTYYEIGSSCGLRDLELHLKAKAASP